MGVPSSARIRRRVREVTAWRSRVFNQAAYFIQGAKPPITSLLTPKLLETIIAAATMAVVAVTGSGSLVIVLVVFLGRVKHACLFDLRMDCRLNRPLASKASRLFSAVATFLVVVLPEDRAAILAADVAKLAIFSTVGSIRDLPEVLDELRVIHARRVVGHAHGFRVPGAAVTNLFIRRIGQFRPPV